MVSRRNFFAMIVTMLILFFMFQFTGMAKTILSDYNINEYENASAAAYTSENMFLADRYDTTMGERPYVLFMGNEDSVKLRETVFWWCTYTKRNMIDSRRLIDYAYGPMTPPQAVVIDGESIDFREQLSALKRLTQRGTHLIFARMPKTEVLEENPELCEFLGIREIRDRQMQLNGIHLFEGFLLGGERIYETVGTGENAGTEYTQMDLDLTVPWYLTDAGTKTYIMGTLLEQGNMANEDLPAILWRKRAEKAMVFCVNGDYLFDMSGIGFLNAMMAETDVYEIYPIVNAQNFSVVNFSGFADENDARMKELYNQSMTAFYRDLIWPSFVSVTYRRSFRLTLFSAAQTDYSDRNEPQEKQLVYFLKLLREDHGELGLSADHIADLAPAERLAKDASFYRGEMGDYKLLSLYVKDREEFSALAKEPLLSDVRTVTAKAGKDEPPVRYLDEHTTFQNICGLAEDHNFSDDLALMAEQTALGYTNVMVDLWNVEYPTEAFYQWENYGRYFSENIVTYWKDYRCFTGTTVAESDTRIRRFLAADYRAKREGNRIELTRTETDGPVWFLLKVNGRDVKQMEGGTFEELKGGFYLVEMTGTKAEIELVEKKAVIR